MLIPQLRIQRRIFGNSLGFLKSELFLFLTLSLCYFVMRALIIFFAPELHHPDEYYQVEAAREIVRGARFALFDLQFSSYEGGTLFVSLVTAQFMKVFGVSLLAVRLSALLFSYAVFALIFFFLREFFSKTAAVIGAALLIFSPPAYTRAGLLITGDFREPLYSLLLMIFFFKASFSIKKKLIWFSLFGALCGFSIWMHYINIIMIVACFVYWFSRDKKIIFRKEFIVCAVAGMIGLLPWVFYSVAYDFSSLMRLSHAFAPSPEGIERSNVILSNLKDFSPWMFPATFAFKDFRADLFGAVLFFDRRIFAYAYYSVFCLAFVYTLAREGNSLTKKNFVLLYLCLFFVVYVSTNYAFDSGNLNWGWDKCPAYYRTILLPFIIIVIAGASGEILKVSRRPWMRFAGGLCLAGAIGVCALGNVALLDTRHQGAPQPFNIPMFMVKQGLRFARYPNVQETLARLNDEEKPYFYFAMGNVNYSHPKRIKVSKRWTPAESVLEKNFEHYYWAGVWTRLFYLLDERAYFQKSSQVEPLEQAVACATRCFLNRRGKEGALRSAECEGMFYGRISYAKQIKEVARLLSVLHDAGCEWITEKATYDGFV